MSFLSQLQKQKNKLKETETVVTKVDGKRYIEKDTTVTAISSNSYGFVVDTKPDNVPVLISDYLYIGSQDCTAQEVIQTYNIQHVLSLGINIQVSVNNKFINCLDLPETSIKEILLDSLPLIRKAVDAKENI
nr:unnamed protein product [Spodoptera littoralis]